MCEGECVMNSARKDGRSFREARTLTEETEAIRAAIPSSTGYKNKWAVEVFKEWQYYRATKGQTSSEVDEIVQTVDTPFEGMNAWRAGSESLYKRLFEKMVRNIHHLVCIV